MRVVSTIMIVAFAALSGFAQTSASGNRTTLTGVPSHHVASFRAVGVSSEEVVTIEQARSDTNGDLIPDYSVSGDTLEVYGVVISPNFLLSSNATSYYIEDSTAGIDVYASGVMDFSEGDSVFVIGTIDIYNGVTEIIPLTSDSTHFGVIEHNVEMPTPKLLTLHDYLQNAEMYEGQLVQIDTLYKVQGTWPKANSNASIYVMDSSKADTVQMYIDKDGGVDGSPEPLFPINLVGVASQYSYSGAGGYQILPRDTADYWKVPGIVSTVSIAQARQDLNKDNVPDFSVTGDTLEVYGVVTSPNYLTSSNATSYYMQDATAGIDLYVGGAVLNYSVGDSVLAVGKILQYNGVTEFEPLTSDSTNLRVLKHNAVVPEPKHLTLHQYMQNAESYEGQLVEIDTLSKVRGTWPKANSNASIYVTNMSLSDTVQIYIDKDTEIDGTAEPSYPINVVGISSQYAPSGVGGFEILPRDTTDYYKVYGVPIVASIATARKDDNKDLVPDYSLTGDTLMVRGVVTSPNFTASANGTSYYVQDATAGIDVYGGGKAMKFNIGDSVFAVGTITQYRGLTELKLLAADSADFGLLKAGATVPQPKLVSADEFTQNGESYEGQLIEIDTLFKASGTWPAAGKNVSVYMMNQAETDTVQVFFDADMGIGGTTEPDYPVNVVGVVSQYASSGVTGGYELNPRDSADVKHIVVVAVKEKENGVPATFYLSQNYPNPFNPSTTINFGLPKEAQVQITVYNILGQRVAMLVDQNMKAGNHQVTFNADRLASGVYFYMMRAGDQLFKQKMLLMK